MNDGNRTPHYTHTLATTWYLAINVILILLTTAFAQRADFEPGPLSLNRRFWRSSEAPLARALNELTPDIIPHMELLIRHIARVEEAVLESLERPQVIRDAPVQPCDPSIDRQDRSYRGSLFRRFGHIGLLEPAWNCASDVSGVNLDMKEPGYTLDDLYNALFSHGVSVKRRVGEIARRLIDNFTRPDVAFNFSYITGSARCSLTPACMYRQGDNWHQEIAIHSNGIDEHVPDGNEYSIVEIFRVVDGQVGDNLLLRLPVYDNGSIERVILANTTTMIQRWRGTPNQSCFRSIPIEENAAILEALDRVEHSVQQAEDAVAKSNLAILILPLGLNFVPIALVADVSTRMMLFYTLMSDVLTVIPLAIKGVELVTIGANRYRSVVTRMVSPAFMNSSWPTAAGGEIWGAECRVREEVGKTGLILIVLSVAFLCVGVGGELVARWYVQRRKSGKCGLVDESIPEDRLGGLCMSPSVSNLAVGAYGVEKRYSFDNVDDDDDDDGKKDSSSRSLLG